MTPTAPTFETTSSWKPDSIQASARGERRIDAVDTRPVVDRARTSLRLAGARASRTAPVARPSREAQTLSGNDHPGQLEVVLLRQLPRADSIVRRDREEALTSETTWTTTTGSLRPRHGAVSQRPEGLRPGDAVRPQPVRELEPPERGGGRSVEAPSTAARVEAVTRRDGTRERRRPSRRARGQSWR